MTEEQRNTLESNILFGNNAQSAYQFPVSAPITNNFGNTHMQMPISNTSLVGNECSPLKKQADTLNLEFKKLIEDLDRKISSLPSGNFHISQGTDIKFGDNFANNLSNSNNGIQTDPKEPTMPNPTHTFDDFHTIKDKINLNERTKNVFERDVAKIHQQFENQFDQMKLKPNENDQMTNQNCNTKNVIDTAYQRRLIHPYTAFNLGRAAKDDDFIRSSRFLDKQLYGINLQQNNIESSLSDSEAVNSNRLQFTQRKAIQELAQSWSRASSSYNEFKQTPSFKPCKEHICGKQGCRYHNDCALHLSLQSFSEMTSPTSPIIPSENVDNNQMPTNTMPNELMKTKLMKGKQKHIFGRRCAC